MFLEWSLIECDANPSLLECDSALPYEISRISDKHVVVSHCDVLFLLSIRVASSISGSMESKLLTL
jgi:hypothetical protein